MSQTTNIADIKAEVGGSHLEHPSDVKLEDVLPKNPGPWYKNSRLTYLNFLLLVPIFSSTGIGYDGSMINGLQAQTQWQNYFNHPTGYTLGHISCGPTYGNFIGVLFAGFIADKWGRKWGIIIGASIMVIASAIQAAAQNYAMFLVARIIIGVGSVIAIVPSPSLLSELSYPTHRAFMTTAYNVMWYGGATLAAWITYGTYWMGEDSHWSWRIPSLLQAFFPLCQLALVYWIPESPRFLIFKDRIDEARKILVHFHADGDESSPLVDFELSEIIQALEMEKQTKNVGFGVLFNKENRRRAFISAMVPFMQQMSGNGLVSYYLSLVLNSIGITTASRQLIINGGLCIYNWGIAMVMTGFVPRFGRRPLLLICTSSMLLIFVIWTILSAINQQRNFEDTSLGRGVLAMIFLYYFAYNIGLLGLPYLYLTEVLPYYIRSQGMALGQFTTACVGIYQAYVNPIAMDAISWKYYIVYCVIITFEFVIVFFFFPETKGSTLEESTEAFDRSVHAGVRHQKAAPADIEMVDEKASTAN
ncbi:general substrate transporter [Kockiozyma suomiensis]|uniref:general substrate transporter n=1 Tax=Kockiozyma suomiensis TaxID=1337062 RepID=UPI003343DA07